MHFLVHSKVCLLMSARSTVWGGLVPSKTTKHQNFKVLKLSFWYNTCFFHLKQMKNKPLKSGVCVGLGGHQKPGGVVLVDIKRHSRGSHNELKMEVPTILIDFQSFS